MTCVFGILYGIKMIGDSEKQTGLIFIISSSVGALIITLPFFAFSELINLFIQIEKNTRRKIENHIYKERETTESDILELEKRKDFKKDR